MTTTPTTHPALPVDWDTDAIIRRRDTWYAASQRAFVPYQTPQIFARGEGQYLWDMDGRKFIDLLGMNVCVSVGHANPTVSAAVAQQAQTLQHCTTMFYHPVPAHYAEELIATLPKGHEWVVHFTSSGAEAVDLALLMSRAYTGNIDFIALQTAYHGATFGAMALTGIKSFRHNVPQLGGIAFTSDPNTYRGLHGDNVQGYLDDLDRTITAATSGHLAGMIIEPVQGYGGIVAMPEGYIKGAFEQVRAAGGVCVIDEVQSGVGRTGESFWAFEQHDVIPDIVVMAKGIGNGFPLGAVVAKRAVAESMDGKFCFHTYGANPTSCAAGRAVLQVMQRENTQINAKQVGAALLERLVDLKKRYPVIGDVRGKGLMLAIELVTDQRTHTPNPDATARVFELARDNGLILSKSGPHKSVLRFVPPLCLSMADVDAVADGLEASFRAL